MSSVVVLFSSGVVPGLGISKIYSDQNIQCGHLSLCLGTTALTSGTSGRSCSVSRGVEASTRENSYKSVYSKTLQGVVGTEVKSATPGVMPRPASLVTTLRSWAVDTSAIRPPSGVDCDTMRGRGTGIWLLVVAMVPGGEQRI